ncbi:myosin h [Cystoisospora suis]|uniref:Myosin h n=1 Tax=Cystoisospora suis TaxID=483139 RepID=A0A2C6LG19_9APIC|nr:myosin h [Cystoisospora suis]
MRVDLRRGGVTGVALDVKVGWWEGVVLSSEGTLWAWNFFDQPRRDVLRPAVYQYLLAEGQHVRSVNVVSSPLFSAVFSQLEESQKRRSQMKGREHELALANGNGSLVTAANFKPSAVRTRPAINPSWDPFSYN